MRILHVCGDNVLKPTGGLGVAVNAITREQAALGHTVSILCYDLKESTYRVDNSAGREIVRANLDSLGQVHGHHKYHRVVYKGLMNTLLWHFRKHEFDIIHLHDTICWPMVEGARYLFRAPVVITSHLSFGIEQLGWPGWNDSSDIDFQDEVTAYAECELSTVSHPYAEEIRRTFGITKDIHVVNNGIDLQPIDRVKPADISHLTHGRKPVYFAGRLISTKGIDLIIEAAKALPDHQFIMFSKVTAHHYDLEPYARKLGTAAFFNENITWIRKHDVGDNLAYLKACDLALVPSINLAPFEITGLEAMAAGTPLVTTAICGMKDYCTPENCDIHDPTPEGLIEAIKGHKRDEGKIAAARKTAERFSWKTSAENYLKVYEVTHAKCNIPIRDARRS